MDLKDMQPGTSYLIKECLAPENIRKHLMHLGIQSGQEIRIISKTNSNVIIQIKTSRLALDAEIMGTLDLVEKENEPSALTLSEIPIGSSVKVVDICATGALRRRLLDMGITKNTIVFLKKTAPLGDPIEISLRGYELSLRKSEAQMVQVQIIRKEASDECNCPHRQSK
ncbi:ferrous iron transport protein A [Streptococcus suis]|nr:ferrous iron transport protein A [Streptococcus suis]